MQAVSAKAHTDLEYPAIEASTQTRQAEAKTGAKFFPSAEEEKLLQINLADMQVPKASSLDVEGLHLSWFDRLFGGR